MIYLPIENECINNTKEKFDDNPEIVVTGIVSTNQLNENLYDIGGLKIGCNDIVALVSTK